MNTGSALARFTVTLSQAVAEPVQVEWFTSDGTAQAGVDYAANKGIVVFAAGETSKTVDILVYGRAVGTEDRSFFVEMLPPTNAILGASIGECIIHVDTSGSAPVTQIIIPTGPQGPKGEDGVSPDPAEIAEEVAPLIDVGATVLTAEGTETLGKPDATTVKAVARRVGYAKPASIGTVLLADGTNVISPSDLTGDTVKFASVGFCPQILRGGTFIEPTWSINDDGSITLTDVIAGDVLYAIEFHTTTNQQVEKLFNGTNAIFDANVREQWRRELADIGLNLVAGSFEAGATLNSSTDAVWHIAGGQAYTWGGTFPKVIPAKSTPSSAGGIDPTHFISVLPTSLRSQMASATGDKLMNFRGLTNIDKLIGDYLREGYIRVSSRDELVAAVNYVNASLKKATEIRLSRGFAPWTAAQTDIDLTWVQLVGEGGFCLIDATGIPSVEGNYWLRLFNSGASNISALGNIYADKLSGIFVLGPGQTSLVDAIIYHNPTGAIASFTTRNLGTMNFRTGDSYRQNAFIIKHWGRSISRCSNHVWMPSGYSNYGEAIEYYASTISTSNGVGVRNDNPDGHIRLFGGSLDYMGRIIVVTAGRVETYGTYIEFNNNSNKLNGIPFETSTAETAKISLKGGGMRGFVNPLPAEVTTLFRCGANTNGISVSDMEMMNLTLPTGYSEMNDGTGPFRTNNIDVISGGGNPRVPMLKADTQNMLFDPDFTQADIVDWFITADTGALTNRTTGVNVKLVKDTVTFRPGGAASMKVTKAFGVGSASEIQVRVPIRPGKLAMYQLFMKGAALTGSIFVNAYYSTTQYQNAMGVPVTARSVQVGPVRTIDATTLTDWVSATQQSARNYTPEWATHLTVRISLVRMSAGDLYIDDVKVTEL